MADPDGTGTSKVELDWAALRARCTLTDEPASRFRDLSRRLNPDGRRRSLALARLSGAICRLSTEVEGFDASLQPPVHALLEDAAIRLQLGDVNEGWASFNAARRASFAGATEEQRRVLASSLRAESAAKLQGWRQEASLVALGASNDTPPSVDQLQRAQLQIDERSSNIYRQLDQFSRALWWVLVLLILSVGAIYVVVGQQWLDHLSGTSLDNTRSLTGIVVLGALGSLLSVAFSRVSASEERLPALIQGFKLDLFRPVLGGASAVALVMLIESGMQSAVQGDGSKIYVWALLAGFSERLLRRTLESVAESTKAAPGVTESSRPATGGGPS